MKKNRKSNNRNFINFLTACLLTITGMIVLYFIHIYQQPTSILNLYPPIEQPMELPQEMISNAVTQTIAHIPTRTATNLPTLTLQPTLTLTPTRTPEYQNKVFIPSNTPDASRVQFSYVTPATNPDAIFYTLTPHPIADYLYEFVLLHEAQPSESPWNEYVPNALLNCNWFGVGGQVLDFEGNPIIGAHVKLGGTYPDDDEFIERYTITTAEHIIGDGGYEFKLSDEPFTAVNSFWVQVTDENGYAISAKAHFSITTHCNVNLIRIDFIQVK